MNEGRSLGANRAVIRAGVGLFAMCVTSAAAMTAVANWYPDRNVYQVPSLPKRVAVGNIDGDAFPDVVVGAQTGQILKAYVYVNSGDGSYSALSELSVDISWWSLCVGDFNGDGLGDVAASGEPAKIYYQGPLGAFTTPGQLLGIPGDDKLTSTRSIDLDGDGADELLGCIPGEPARGRIYLYWGDNVGLDSSPDELVVNLYSETDECWIDDDYFTGLTELEVGDVDQDGDIDIWFTANCIFGEEVGCLRRGLGWYENLGQRSFAGVHWIHRDSMEHPLRGYSGAAHACPVRGPERRRELTKMRKMSYDAGRST